MSTVFFKKYFFLFALSINSGIMEPMNKEIARDKVKRAKKVFHEVKTKYKQLTEIE